MGLVLGARHLTLGRRVAVKLLQPALAANPSLRRRFLREARAAAIVDDPRVVTVTDVGESPTGLAFIVMELLAGQDLYTWANERALTWRDAAWLGLRIAEILAVLHGRGLIHRDLKPENVWVCEPVDAPAPDRAIKLLDFGVVALIEQEADERLTQTGVAVGTPRFMAPEQIRAGDVDHRADLYALGCLIWELLCGQGPFEAGSKAELHALHLYEPVPSLRAAAAEVPQWLASLVEQLLAKDRGARPVDATAVVVAIRSGLRAPEAPPPRAPGRAVRAWPWAAALAGAAALGISVWAWPAAGGDEVVNGDTSAPTSGAERPTAVDVRPETPAEPSAAPPAVAEPPVAETTAAEPAVGELPVAKPNREIGSSSGTSPSLPGGAAATASGGAAAPPTPVPLESFATASVTAPASPPEAPHRLTLEPEPSRMERRSLALTASRRARPARPRPPRTDGLMEPK